PLCRHIRQLELDRLKLADRFAELPPLLRISHRGIERSARHPQAQRSNRDPSAIQHPHRILESIAFIANHALGRNLTIFKDQLRGIASPEPQLVLFSARPKPGCSLLHYKSRYPA